MISSRQFVSFRYLRSSPPKSFLYLQDLLPEVRFSVRGQTPCPVRVPASCGGQYGSFVDFEADAVADKLRLLVGSHEFVSESGFRRYLDGGVIQLLAGNTRTGNGSYFS